MNKRAGILIIKKRETPAPRNMYDLNEHLINNMNTQYLDVRIQGRQKRPNKCIRKGEVLVHVNIVYKITIGLKLKIKDN